MHFDKGRLALRMDENIKAGRRAIAGYEEYDAFVNMDVYCEHRHIEIGRHFRVLAEQEPDALFILNVRDADRWVTSRLRWFSSRDLSASCREQDVPCIGILECRTRLSFREKYRRYHALPDDDDALKLHMKTQWYAHINAVRSDLPADRLLVFDIERDDPARLCEFLGLPPNMARHWQHWNASPPQYLERLRRHTPTFIRQCIPRQLKEYIKLRLAGMGRHGPTR